MESEPWSTPFLRGTLCPPTEGAPLATDRRVLILCTGNSCRSALAEALWRHHWGDLWEVRSAGTDLTPDASAILETLRPYSKRSLR